MHVTTSIRRASGEFFGLALGDALGARTEFLSVASILEQFLPAGPTAPEGIPRWSPMIRRWLWQSRKRCWKRRGR